MSEPPDKVPCTTDPGDDTQRRFRYQATQAAILALALLDDETDIDELFCEHHEDILLKVCAKTRFSVDQLDENPAL